jgi:hypothetical protein
VTQFPAPSSSSRFYAARSRRGRAGPTGGAIELPLERFPIVDVVAPRSAGPTAIAAGTRGEISRFPPSLELPRGRSGGPHLPGGVVGSWFPAPGGDRPSFAFRPRQVGRLSPFGRSPCRPGAIDSLGSPNNAIPQHGRRRSSFHRTCPAFRDAEAILAWSGPDFVRFSRPLLTPQVSRALDGPASARTVTAGDSSSCRPNPPSPTSSSPPSPSHLFNLSPVHSSSTHLQTSIILHPHPLPFFLTLPTP